MKIDTELAKRFASFEGPIDKKTLIAAGEAHSNLGWRILAHLPFGKRIAERHFLEKSQNVLSFLNDQTLRRLHGARDLPKNYLLTDRIFFMQPLIQTVGEDSTELKELINKVSDHRKLAACTEGLSKSELEPIIKHLSSLSKDEVNTWISSIQPGVTLTVEPISKKAEPAPTVWTQLQSRAKENPGLFFAPTLPPVLQAICPTADLDQLPAALTEIGPLFTELTIAHEAIDSLHLLENHPDSAILLDILHAKRDPSELTAEALGLLDARIAEAKTSDNWIGRGVKRMQQEVQKAHALCQEYRGAKDTTSKLEFAHKKGEWDPLVLYLFVYLDKPAQKVDVLRGALNTRGISFLIKTVAPSIAATLPGLITHYIDEMLKQIVGLALCAKAKQEVSIDSKTNEQTERLARACAVLAPQMTQDLELLVPVLDYMSYLNKAVQQNAPITDDEFKNKTIAFLEAISQLIKTSFYEAIKVGVKHAPKALDKKNTG